MTAPARIRRAILDAGEALGFLRPRVTRIVPLPREAFLEGWLAEGRAADMRYLLHHRKARLDPRTRYPWARSIISAFFPYRPPPPPDGDWRRQLRGRIAAYAAGRDYHAEIALRLALWRGAIRQLAPGARTRAAVDSSPVLEHDWAMRAGVGWTGKHTLTIDEDAGSYAFLAEILLELPLEPDAPVPERCGTCSRCLDQCPTGAIESGYRLDPRRCISYLTIEHRGSIPPSLRPSLSNWIFGCDVCQWVCPWNRERSEPDPALAPSLPAILSLDRRSFRRRYGGTALARAGRVRLARNAAVALGNSANPAALAPLVGALHERPEALVRAHAAWAIGRIAATERRACAAALERSRRDPAAEVRAEVEAALAATEEIGERGGRC